MSIQVVATSLDEDFQNTSRTYYQIEGMTGWIVLYSDDSDAEYKYDDIAAAYKYDRWVKYEGDECYHSEGAWVCFVAI